MIRPTDGVDPGSYDCPAVHHRSGLIGPRAQGTLIGFGYPPLLLVPV